MYNGVTIRKGCVFCKRKTNVESFDLDHTKVKAPYVRLAGVKTGKMAMKYINTIFALNSQIRSIWKCLHYIL